MIFQAILYGIWRSWLPVHFFGLMYTALFVALAFKLPESPKFLYATSRFDEAREVLAAIAWENGSLMKKDEVRAIVFDKERMWDDLAKTAANTTFEQVEEGPAEKDVIILTGSMKEVWSIWQIRRNAACICCILATCSVVYYTINF